MRHPHLGAAAASAAAEPIRQATVHRNPKAHLLGEWRPKDHSIAVLTARESGGASVQTHEILHAHLHRLGLEPDQKQILQLMRSLTKMVHPGIGYLIIQCVMDACVQDQAKKLDLPMLEQDGEELPADSDGAILSAARFTRDPQSNRERAGREIGTRLTWILLRGKISRRRWKRGFNRACRELAELLARGTDELKKGTDKLAAILEIMANGRVWLDPEIVKYPYPVAVKGGMRLPSFVGKAGSMFRLVTDGKIFSRPRERFGSAVIDASYSVSWTEEELRSLLELEGIETIAIYGLRNPYGYRLHVIAEKGYRVADKMLHTLLLHQGHGNCALEKGIAAWFSRQPGPRTWITDGQWWTGDSAEEAMKGHVGCELTREEVKTILVSCGAVMKDKSTALKGV